MAAQFGSVIILAVVAVEQATIEHMVAAIKHTIANAVQGIAEAAATDTEEPTAVDKGCTTTAADIKFTVVQNLEQVALASAIIMVDYITIIA